MKYYKLVKSQFIEKPINEVFSFFEKPENLQEITPPYLNFKIITPSPIKMEVGQVISYKIKLRGIPIKWNSLISSYDPPNSFIDQQIKGPYAIWHHTHRFKEQDGGTLIEDEVKYAIPFSILGRILNYIFIKNDLKKIFLYREEKIGLIFKNDNIKGK